MKLTMYQIPVMYLIYGIGKEYCRRFCIQPLHLQWEIFLDACWRQFFIRGWKLPWLSASRFTFSGTGPPSGLQARNVIKKRLQHRYFPVKFAKYWRTPFFKEHRQWMLLRIFPWINLGTVFSRLNLCSRLISDLSRCFGKSRGILH